MDTVLITGGSSGIGFEMAKCFCARQANVIIVARHQEALDKAKKELVSTFATTVDTYAVDLSKDTGPQELLDKLVSNKTTINILVNNAGFGITGKSESVDFEKEKALIQLNEISLVQMCKLFIPMLKKQPNAKILNVASIGAFMPGPYISTYYASKAFVYSYSRAIRYELKDDHISVSVLCPGPVRTAFFDKAHARTPKWAMDSHKVAAIAVKGLMKNKEVIVPGFINKLARIAPKKIAMKYTAELKK